MASHPSGRWHKLYSTGHWVRRRKAQLRESPFCEACLERGVPTPATVADHVEQHHGDVNKFFLGALRSLCLACHNRQKRLEELQGWTPEIDNDGWPTDPRHPSNRPRASSTKSRFLN
jgi:5-methylcytosine-specific restriction enzyme A